MPNVPGSFEIGLPLRTSFTGSRSSGLPAETLTQLRLWTSPRRCDRSFKQTARGSTVLRCVTIIDPVKWSMSEPRSEPRLALLIDADNVPAACADGMVNEAALHGQVVVKEAFGDFQLTSSEAWSRACEKHGIGEVQLDRALSGKNAADVALAIRAVDLLHRGEIDGLVLASGDTDFVPLVARFQDDGLPVYIFAQSRAPERLRDIATLFVFLENLARGHPANTAGSLKKPLRSPDELRRVIMNLVADLDDGSGWTTMARVHGELLGIDRHFDVRTYGFRNLVDLCARLRGFVVDSTRGEPVIRLKAESRRDLRRRMHGVLQ